MKLAELTKCTGCKIVFRHKQIGTGTILYKIELKSFRYEYEFITVTQNFLLKVVGIRIRIRIKNVSNPSH